MARLTGLASVHLSAAEGRKGFTGIRWQTSIVSLRVWPRRRPAAQLRRDAHYSGGTLFVLARRSCLFGHSLYPEPGQ